MEEGKGESKTIGKGREETSIGKEEPVPPQPIPNSNSQIPK